MDCSRPPYLSGIQCIEEQRLAMSGPTMPFSDSSRAKQYAVRHLKARRNPPLLLIPLSAASKERHREETAWIPDICLNIMKFQECSKTGHYCWPWGLPRTDVAVPNEPELQKDSKFYACQHSCDRPQTGPCGSGLPIVTPPAGGFCWLVAVGNAAQLHARCVGHAGNTSVVPKRSTSRRLAWRVGCTPTANLRARLRTRSA